MKNNRDNFVVKKIFLINNEHDIKRVFYDRHSGDEDNKVNIFAHTIYIYKYNLYT